MLIKCLLQHKLSEDFSEFLSAGEHTDREDLNEFGFDAWNLLISDVLCDTFLHEIESGSGWGPAQAHLNHLNKEVAEWYDSSHTKVCSILGQERHTGSLKVRDCIIKELQELN